MAGSEVSADIEAIGRLEGVQTALQVLLRTSGLRIAMVVRVTENVSTTCAVLDEIGLGLKPGDQSDPANTF